MNAARMARTSEARNKWTTLRGLAFGLLCIWLTVGAAPTAGAWTLEWSPLSMDFGIVYIGESETRTLTLTNTDAVGPLEIHNIWFTYNDRGAFDFTTSEPLPAVLPPGGSMEVTFTFTPPEWSFFMADILVDNSSVNASPLYYSMLGMGEVGSDPCDPFANCDGQCVDLAVNTDHCGSCFNACPVDPHGTSVCEVGACSLTCEEGYELVGDSCEPNVPQTALEMLRSLIGYVDDAIAEGTLVGVGPGSSAENNLKNFVKALEIAEINFRTGFVQNTCDALKHWPRRADGGIPVPPDWLGGEAAYIVRDKIIAVMDAIKTEYPWVTCEPKPAIVPPAR